MNFKRLGFVVCGATLLALMICGMIGARSLPGGPLRWSENTLHTLATMGPLGAAIFFLILIFIAFSGALPASLIGVAAGTVYGVAQGFLLSITAVMVGAWLSFFAARTLFRNQVENLLSGHSRLKSIDERLAQESWRFVCLLRISPVMPFALTSYMLGLSSVSRRDYTLGTLAAMPALLGFVCIGNMARAGLSASLAGATYFRWAILIVGIIATILLTLQIGRITTRSRLLETK